jgi:predicted dehydrogenase
MSSLPEPDNTPLKGGPTLRWGVLAPGSIAGQWVGTLHANTDQRVAAVASRSLARAEEFAAQHGIARAYGGYEQLVADPGVDAVYVAAPHSEHLALGLLAIAAGKHVLIEKPIGVNAAQARELKAAASAAGVLVMEAMWSCYLPQTTVVARLLADGALGDVLAVTADFGAVFEFDPAGRGFDPALGGGALLDLGVYPGWFAHFVLGAPERVTATGTLTVTGVDEQSAVILDYASRAQAVITTSLVVETPRIATVSGTRARLEFAGPFFAPSDFTLVRDGERIPYTDRTGFTWGEGLCYQAAAFASYVADGLLDSPLHSMDDTVAVLEVLDSARAQLGAL